MNTTVARSDGTGKLALGLDTAQSLAQLELLGYTQGDKVYYGLLVGKGLSGDPSRLAKDFPHLPSQPKDKGLYIVVNGGGQKDENVSHGRAFFCEWDDRPIEEQVRLWEKLGFLEPTFQIQTRKSIHSYWVLTDPCPIDLWRPTQEKLLNHLDGDRTLKNPSRLMRLAGSWHYKEGAEPIQCKVINATGKKYSLSEIENALPSNPHWSDGICFVDPEPKKPKPKLIEPTAIGIDPIPLEITLARISRDLIAGGCSENRNANGAKLARDLIGTENHLISNNIAYSGDAYQLFLEFCKRCPGDDWSQKEWENIWRKAQKDNPQPTLSSDKIENCINAYLKRQGKNSLLQVYNQDTASHLDLANESYKPDTSLDIQEDYTEKARKAIYGDGHYISVYDDLYVFNGKFYERCNDGDEKLKIVAWAKITPVGGKFSYCKPEIINKIWNWVLLSYSINQDKINPSGLNLDNGILKISWEGKIPKWELHPHSPNAFFLYCSKVSYQPQADSLETEKLLAVLDPSPRVVFLRIAAAALDLKTVRKFLGRTIRAAICRGAGANGKDSLREAIALIFGPSHLCSATLGDFNAYDDGRKFPLAKLRKTKINWPSENNKNSSLDGSESLNAAITGEELYYERKGKDEESFHPECVHFFNVNRLPKLKSGLDSLESRFCVLSFDKTFKQSPNPDRGELKADPRFKDDPDFLIERVCPGLLNILLKELKALMQEGINYESIKGAMQDVQEDSTHLWAFCNDVGLVPSPGGFVYISELWNRLEEWYLDNGTLEIITLDNGKTKRTWNEQANQSDQNVKGTNQVFKRFKALFPKIKQETDRSGENKNRAFICGLSFSKTALPALPISHNTVPTSFSTPYAALPTALPVPYLPYQLVGQLENQVRQGDNPENLTTEGFKPQKDSQVRQVGQFSHSDLTAQQKWVEKNGHPLKPYQLIWDSQKKRSAVLHQRIAGGDGFWTVETEEGLRYQLNEKVISHIWIE